MKWAGFRSKRPGAATRAALPFAASPREILLHLAWSVGLAAMMAATLLLEPVDWMIWNLQARVGNQALSDRTIFVQAPGNLSDPNVPEQRVLLARALDRTREQGAARVFVDTVFEQAARDPAADAALKSALDRWGTRALLVNRIDVTPDGERQEVRTVRRLSYGRQVVWSGITKDWPGFTWKMPYAYRTREGLQPSMAASLAGSKIRSTEEFQIDYGFRSKSVQALSLVAVASGEGKAPTLDLAGKTLVIGIPADASPMEMRLPGQFTSPPSFVPIFAAETLKRGIPTY